MRRIKNIRTILSKKNKSTNTKNFWRYMKPMKRILLYIFGSLVFAFIIFWISTQIFVQAFMAQSATTESQHFGIIFGGIVSLCVLVCVWGSIIFVKIDLLSKKIP